MQEISFFHNLNQSFFSPTRSATCNPEDVTLEIRLSGENSALLFAAGRTSLSGRLFSPEYIIMNKVGFGLALGLLFVVSFLSMPVRTLAQAATTGKTMMTPFIDKSGRDVVLTWNTETGKSVFYTWNNQDQKWAPYEINIPSPPLPGFKGKVMMAPYIDKIKRDVVLVWDNATGKSLFYTWDGDKNNWTPYLINLPAVPVTGAKGAVMMSPYVDKVGRDVVLTWDTVSGKSVFYVWDGGVNNWKPYPINLPTIPVPN